MASMKAPICLILLLVLGQVWMTGVARGATIPYYGKGSKMCSGSPSFLTKVPNQRCNPQMNPVNRYPTNSKFVANRMCTQPLPGNILNQLKKVFPADGSVPSITEFTKDIYINITEPNTYFKITYLNADCDNRNALGYFTYNWKSNSYQLDPSMGKGNDRYPGPMIFYDMSSASRLCYSKGYSIEYGPFRKGQTIAFYFVTNAAWSNYAGGNAWLSQVHYTIGSMNKVGYRPAATWFHMPSIGQYVIGLDDDAVGRDLSYDDLVVGLELNRKNVSIIDPPIYGDGKLDVCKTVLSIPSTIWLERPRYIYTLLLPHPASECVNSQGIPSGWSWSPYDEDAQSAHPIGVSTVWAGKAKELFMYYVPDDGTGNSRQVSVTGGGKVSTPSEIHFFKGNERCIWTGCGALVVIRKPSPSNSVPPSRCRADDNRPNLYYDKTAKAISPVVPSLTIVKIAGLTDKKYKISNLQLTWPKPAERKMEVILLIEKSGNSNTGFQSICSETSAGQFIFQLNKFCSIPHTDINVYLGNPQSTGGYMSLGLATNTDKLKKIFEKARATKVSSYKEKSSILNAGRLLMNRSSKSAYHIFIVMTNTAWNAADEAKFVDKAKLSNWDLTFVTGKATRASATKLLSRIPFSWIGAANWDSSWVTNLFKDGVITKNYKTINMRVTNSSLASLFTFGPQPGGFTMSKEYTMNLTYTINWKRSHMIANSPVVSAELVVRGWGTTVVNLEYNLPPIGMNLSVKCKDLNRSISLPIRDLNNDKLNVLFTKVPSHGKLIHPQTGKEIKVGDYLNKFSKDGTAIGVLENKVIYRRGINGNYTFKYIVDDGCERSPEYVVTINTNAMNVQIVARDKLINVSSGSYLSTAKPFTLESCMFDEVDPYYPIYVRPRILPDPIKQGTLYDSKKKPVTMDKSKKYLLEDPFYYIPVTKPTHAPGKKDGVFVFALEESTPQLNLSNTAWLYVNLSHEYQRPLLTFQYTSINIVSRSKTSFTPIVGDRSEYELELYLADMPTGNSIYLNNEDITTNGTFPIKLLGGIKPTVSGNYEVTLSGFTWGTSATGGTIKGVFYVKRVGAKGSNEERLANATLTLTVQDAGDVRTDTTAYAVTVPPFDQGDRSTIFDLLGTDLLTSSPGSKDMKFVIEGLSDDIGRLYRTDTNASVSGSVPQSASDVYGPTQGNPFFYGSKLSLYLAPILLRNRTYASGNHSFKYTVFNGYSVSESKSVLISIRRKTILPTSENRTVYVQEGIESTHRVPIVVRNGLPGYLDFGMANNDPKLTVFMKVDTNDLDTAIVRIKSDIGYYCYLPDETPVLPLTLLYHACEGDSQCSNVTYGIEVYIVHVPHPPISRECTIRVIRTQLETVALPATDIDDYDKGKLRVTLMFNARPTGQFYLDQEKTQSIDTSVASVQIDSTTFYYVCDTLMNDLDLPAVHIPYFVTDTTGLTSSQSMLTILVNPRGDAPKTSLDRVSLYQGTSIVFSLSDPKLVTVERLDSSARATITSLPLDLLYECSDADCTIQTLLDTVPVRLSQAGAGSILLYRPSLSNWGQDYTSINYTLVDERTKKSEIGLKLAIDVIHVNAAPVLVNHGIASTILKQSDVYEFSWSLTDVDTPLEQLYSIINLTFANTRYWSLARCKDVACLDTEVIIAPEDVKNSTYVLQPSVIIRSGDCPLENDTSTHTHNSPLEECSALFKYRLYADQSVIYSTLFTFSLVGSDSLSFSNSINNVALTHLFVNRPPSIWVPELIVSEKNILSPFIRDNNETSPSYNQSVTITDPGYRMPCLEKLTITANTTGTFNYPEELNCTSSGKASTHDPISDGSIADNTVVCVGTVPGLNKWLHLLRFTTNESYISLNFTISDEGCSTGVTEGDVVYAASAITRIELTAKLGNFGNGTLGIAIGAAAIVSAAALGVLSYFLRDRFTSPPDVYFDIGSEKINTAPENPLFQSSNREHISPIYGGT